MSYEPARTLRDVHRVTNPVKPLESGDPRYVPCEEVRGNEDVVALMFDTITWEEEGNYACQLFTGHRGCGKSTELLRLKARLEGAGYAVIYFEGSDDLDLNDVQYSDIILAIVRRVTSDLAQQGIDLDEGLLEQVLDWFAETLYTRDEWRDLQLTLEAEAALGVGLPAQIPLVARLLARVTGQIQSGEQVKHSIRRKLDPQISQLTERANLLFDEARRKLEHPLVIIVDNLDRVTLQEIGLDRTNHDAIYIDHGDQLRGLAAHVIFTIPISMFYSVRAPVLTAVFPDYAVLPMIKSRTREGQPAEAGLLVLREILGRRIALDEVLTNEAVDHLCQMCGGHPRDLMSLVRYSTRYAQNRWPHPIDLNAATRATGKLITEYNRTIPEEHYPLIARVHLDKSISNDAAHRLMLYNQSVLEYYNGPPPWHDVHPTVLELPKFQAAFEEERRNRGLFSV